MADVLAFFVGDRRSLFSIAPWTELLAGALLLFTLALPTAPNETAAPDNRPGTLWIVVDVGPSMLCKDLPGGRLEFAKSLSGSLIERWSGKVRVSAFAGDAALVAPATADTARVRHAVSTLEAQTTRRPGYGSAGVVAHLSTEALDEPVFGVVLADGNGGDLMFQGDAAGQAGSWLVVGLGNPARASPIPRAEGGWLVEEGWVAESRRDDRALHRLAVALGGGFLSAWPDASAVAERVLKVAQDPAIETRSEGTTSPERLRPLAVVALVLVLRPWRWAKGLRTTATIALIAGWATPTYSQDGRPSYERARTLLVHWQAVKAHDSFVACLRLGERPGWSHWGLGNALASLALEAHEPAARRALLAEAIEHFRRSAAMVEDPKEHDALLANIAVTKRLLVDAIPERSPDTDGPSKLVTNIGTTSGNSETALGVGSDAERKAGTEIGGGAVENPVTGVGVADPGPLSRASAESMIDAIARKAAQHHRSVVRH